MTSFLFDAELARLAIIVGVVLGVLLYNRFGVTAGGAIVPGYLALFIEQPSHIVATFCIALATYYIVQKQLRPRLMLWGGRLFEMELLIAFLLQISWMGYLNYMTQSSLTFSLFTTIGFVLPGILAHDMGRQGVTRTLQMTLGCTAVVFMIVSAVAGLRTAFGIEPVIVDSQLVPAGGQFFMTIGFSLLAALLLRKSRFKTVIGTGGFVTAAYLVTLAQRPLDVLVIVAGAAVTYLVVTQLIMKQAIVFGRSKMASMILVGMLVTWLFEFGLQQFMNYTPWPGLYVIVPMMMALLANDAQRKGAMGTAAGVVAACAIVFAGVQMTGMMF